MGKMRMGVSSSSTIRSTAPVDRDIETVKEVPFEVVRTVVQTIEVPVEVIKEVRVEVPVEVVRVVTQTVEVPVDIIKEVVVFVDRQVDVVREVKIIDIEKLMLAQAEVRNLNGAVKLYRILLVGAIVIALVMGMR